MEVTRSLFPYRLSCTLHNHGYGTEPWIPGIVQHIEDAAANTGIVIHNIICTVYVHIHEERQMHTPKAASDFHRKKNLSYLGRDSNPCTRMSHDIISDLQLCTHTHVK